MSYGLDNLRGKRVGQVMGFGQVICCMPLSNQVAVSVSI